MENQPKINNALDFLLPRLEFDEICELQRGLMIAAYNNKQTIDDLMNIVGDELKRRVNEAKKERAAANG